MPKRLPPKTQPVSQNSEAFLSVHLAADAEDAIYRKIQSALEEKPELLTIELIGHSALTTDLCLALFQLLTSGKNPATKILLKVNCSLVDGQVLLVCAADRVQFAPRRFVRVTSHERFLEILERCRDTAGVVEEVHENSAGAEYGEILKILNQYLPVAEFFDQQVPLEKLSEYFAEDEGLQEILSKCSLGSESRSVASVG